MCVISLMEMKKFMCFEMIFMLFLYSTMSCNFFVHMIILFMLKWEEFEVEHDIHEG